METASVSTDAAHKLSLMHHRCVNSTRDILHPVHYNNQYKSSSSVGLWRVFAVSSLLDFFFFLNSYIFGPQFEAPFEERSMSRS